MLDDASKIAGIVVGIVVAVTGGLGGCFWMWNMWRTGRDTHNEVKGLRKWRDDMVLKIAEADSTAKVNEGKLQSHDATLTSHEKRLDKHEEWIGEIRSSEVFRPKRKDGT